KKYTPLQPDTTWIRQHRRILLAIIILLALATRVVRLNTPPERYHDEVYHAYTAEQWVRGNTDAWLWDKSAPNPNCAYEWTHPPLAKLLMTASMGVFGIHPWAWRLPAALLGTLCAALVYWIARNLFERESIALLAAALYSLDTLPLVMSRVGMNDIYCVTFVLVAVLAALRHRYFLSAMSVGAALACKWSALYALPLLALIYLIRPHPRYRRHLGYLTSVCIIHVLAIVGIYMAAYIPFFKAGHSIDQFCDLQEQMWFYHTGLTATHPGSSPAWAWPLNRGALWLYTSKTVNPKANIYAVGSPIIWFAGLLAILFSAYQLIQKPNQSLGVVLAGYLFFWAPWLMSPRIMFINHYLPSLPFLYIALAHAVVDRKLSITNIICLLSLAVLCLVVFFPYITACPLPAILSPLNIQQQISTFFSISRPT
ncbi:MAG: glycosyltransferase family 39 protein, partial [Planctomycetota bacterium]